MHYSISEPFECDEPEIALFHTQSRVNVPKKEMDFRFGEDIDDDYESVEVCETFKREIYPKALNSIHNRMTPVVNTKEIAQLIQTEECS